VVFFGEKAVNVTIVALNLLVGCGLENEAERFVMA